MKTWGIIGALDAEIALLRSELDLEKTVNLYGCDFFCGSLHGHSVVLVCCGVGTINAAVCTSVIIREFGAQIVINVGIAGSACPELHVLDVVIADELLFHDADLDILEKYYPNRRSFPTDKDLQQLAIQAMESLPEKKFEQRVGLIASGDAYVTDSQRKQNIIDRHSPLCIEMEGAAIAQVAWMNTVPCLVVRTISDNADETANLSYDNFFQIAANQSASILQQMLILDSQNNLL